MKRTKVYSTSLNSADGVKTVDLKGKRRYIDADVKMDAEHYTGVLLRAGDMEYGVEEESLKPYIKIGGKGGHLFMSNWNFGGNENLSTYYKHNIIKI